MTDPQEPTGFNTHVGRAVARLRKHADLSQADLALALTERGLSFQQQTVLKVEKGARPLRLEEAAVVADVLGVPVADLISDDPALDQLRAAQAVRQRLEAQRAMLAAELAQVEQALQVATQREWEAQHAFHRGEDDGE